MNIFDKGFSSSEAQIRYLDGDYVVVRPGESLTARLAEGDLGVTASGAPALRRRNKPKPTPPDSGQTSLF